MNKGYLISLAKRYKEGEISKTMFEKFYECELNCIIYDIINNKMNWHELIPYMMSLVLEIIQFATILKQPRLKYPINNLEIACIIGEEDEVKITPNKKYKLTDIKNIINKQPKLRKFKW